MAYSRAVRDCNSMAWRLAQFLDWSRAHRDLRRWGRSLRGWGHGQPDRLPPVKRQGCTIGSPNLWFVFFRHYSFWLFCYFCCNLTLLLLVILLFPLLFDIIAFGYFVISIVTWHYCFWLFCYSRCDLTLLLLALFCYFHCDLTLFASSYYVRYVWTEHAIVAFSYLVLVVSNFTTSIILSYELCDGLSEMPFDDKL